MYTTIFCLIIAAGFTSVRGDCWTTGCQLDSWATVGCAQYGRVESGRTPCSGGYMYTCCTGDGGGQTSTSTSTTAPSPGGDWKTGDVTYYNLGMTACGQTFTDNDLVAAIAFSYWSTANPNLDPICGRQVLVQDPASGKSVTVRVFDKCGGCKAGDIDLSPAAFAQLRDFGVGRFQGQWKFI